MNDEYFKNLEKRIERIEEFLELGEYKPKKSTSDDLPEQEKSESLSLEVRIGEYWLARIGVIVLVVGAAFFISYPFQNLSPIFFQFIWIFGSSISLWIIILLEAFSGLFIQHAIGK